MSEKCDLNCSSCPSASKPQKKVNEFSASLHEMSSVKKVIGIVSGKGGVGKSLVTSLLSVGVNKAGYKTAILDADITGPSIPKSFGITKNATQNELGLIPAMSKNGTQIMSLNVLTEDETEPVIWRGPVIAGAVKQFWSDVIWTDVDYMFVDMPPGTGDVPLTVFQSLPVDGIVIVTSPQELVGMIVTKAVKMAKKMNIPILGIVENMSYILCPDCNKQIKVFGESNTNAIADEFGIDIVTKIPLNPVIAQSCDRGEIETVDTSVLQNMIDMLVGLGD